MNVPMKLLVESRISGGLHVVQILGKGVVGRSYNATYYDVFKLTVVDRHL